MRARAAIACSMAWRRAVAALTAANTSLRAASTSDSKPSIWRWAVTYSDSSAASVCAAASRSSVARAAAPRFELLARRLLPGVERLDLALDRGGRGLELLDLLAVERDLLLQPPDLELGRVRRFARRGRLVVRLQQLEPQALEDGLELRE